MADYRSEAPEILRSFLTYHETIRGHSKKTVDEYYLDLRMFFRYMKIVKGRVPRDFELDSIPIRDIDLAFVKSVTLSDVYDFLSYLARDREVNHEHRPAGKELGLSATARARKIASIRSYYKYLLKMNLISENPVQDLDSPKVLKPLPRYLSLDESVNLLESVDGNNAERDFCILTLFLNCGLRISELVGLNLTDIRADSLRILGKGSKERVVYLNEACVNSINSYLQYRKNIASVDKNALFLSSRRTRISKSTVHNVVKKRLAGAGLDTSKYSAHKLRHTAATLMLHNGVDVRTLQELLGHEHLNTTEIYTHVENENLREAALKNPLSAYTHEKKT